MTEIADQPAPVSTTKTPSWQLVMDFIKAAWPQEEPVVALILADMQERDKVGRERYGTPLQAGNGRKHLVDAYQELLDGVVYLRTEIEERGIKLEWPLDASGLSEINQQIVMLFIDTSSRLPLLRELIEAAYAEPGFQWKL
jgi:hypothetical protein